MEFSEKEIKDRIAMQRKEFQAKASKILGVEGMKKREEND